MAAWALVAMVVWSLFAFGAVYPWAAAPLIPAAAILAALARPTRSATAETRTLDRWFFTSVAAAALKVVPLPPSLRTIVTPQAGTVDSAISLAPDSAGDW